jgi:uncharacterized membrane protein
MAWLIFIRVVLSVSANTVQKRLLLDGVLVTPMWLVTYLLMLVPGLVLAMIGSTSPASSFWVYVVIGGLLDALGNLAMVAALRSTDLSIFGPLNAFRPVLALLFGWVFLSETPTVAGATGVGVIMAGTLVLFSGEEGFTLATWKAALRTLAFRFAGMTLSTIGAVFLKRAALAGSAELTLAVWIACGLAGLLVFSLARGGRPVVMIGESFRKDGAWLGWHAALFFLMQWATIHIFQHTLLAYSFAFFQLGMALQVVMGRVFFKEKAVSRRMAGCVIMGVGCALVVWKG